ncbi:uncharacterized protein J3R85_006499 [Psidium guajava]|nr:uncharacterized protein J3R85_006499 [Psidium guajava]
MGPRRRLHSEFSAALNKLVSPLHKMNDDLKSGRPPEGAGDGQRRGLQGCQGKEYRGNRSAAVVDNLAFGMKQCFDAMGIKEDETKAQTVNIYSTDVAMLWQRQRCDDERWGAKTI